VIRSLKRICVPLISIASVSFCSTLAAADPQPNEPSTPAASASSLDIQLNKLEAADKGCRAYIVINNTSDKEYQSFKLDLVLFQTDGVIGRRFSIDLAPLKPQKRSVKLFDIDGMACDKIGSFLINDVLECKSATGPVDSCLSDVKTSSLTKVQLSK
jgi:hypothetical protein